MDPSEVLVVQVVFSAVPTCLGNNGNVMRRHVQLMGGLPLLGAQVAGEVPLGVGYALLESEVAPLLGHKAHLPLCC